MSVRSRQVVLVKEPYRRFLGGWVTFPPREWVSGFQVTDSQNNQWNKVPSARKTDIDRGSNFSTFLPIYVESNFRPRAVREGGTEGFDGYSHIGDTDINQNWFSNLGIPVTSELGLLAYGTTAIARVLPTNPVASVATMMGELKRDGLPSMVGSNILPVNGRRFRPGSEYLNLEFAVKPFISDLTDFAKAANNAQSIIRALEQNSGRILRRRYDFPPTRTTTRVTTLPGQQSHTSLSGLRDFIGPSLWTSTGGSFGTRVDVNVLEVERWFSGAFTYYVNVGKGPLAKLARNEQEIRRLYGGLTTSTVWNLLPWSWAVDWVSNAGDVLHNLDAFQRDGLVMKYGYIMEKSSFISTRTLSGAKYGNALASSLSIQTLPSVIATTLGCSSKRRRQATPYGFGLDPSGFTGRQWAILSALGLSRAGR